MKLKIETEPLRRNRPETHPHRALAAIAILSACACISIGYYQYKNYTVVIGHETALAGGLVVNNHMQTVDKREVAVAFGTKDISRSIAKRAWWSVTGSDRGAKMIIATDTAFTTLALASCKFGPSVLCVGTVVVSMAAWLVFAIGIGKFYDKLAEDFGLNPRKREYLNLESTVNKSSYVFGPGYSYTDVLSAVMTDLQGVFNDGQSYYKRSLNSNISGLHIISAGYVFITPNNTTVKSTNPASVPLLHFVSVYGSHVAMHLQAIGVYEFAEIVASAELNAIQGMRAKRNFNAVWASITASKVDQRYAKDWKSVNQLNSDAGSSLASEMDVFFSQYGVWKACVAAQSSDADWQQGYDMVEYGNVFKGETYINTYGALDDECTGPKDGADSTP